jgi:hypothetical protein
MSSLPPEPKHPPAGAGQQALVHATLERVLASPAFRNSKQCQKFLRYVVEQSLTAHEEKLRERLIGVEVFGRDPAYDTADDPVVRVRATEIRKRLAQYYQESAHPGDVRMDVPSGAYRVEFHFSAAPAAVPAGKPVRARRAGMWTLFAAAAVGVAALAIWNRPRAPATALDQFWAPVLESPKPVLLYCGRPVVYFLSREVHEKFRATQPPDSQKGSYEVVLDPEARIRGRDIIPVSDQFVGIGNAHTSALLSAFFAARRKPVEIRYANDLSFSDLRGAPSVLIGAFSNLWTLEMTGKLRFVFEQTGGVRRIRDHTTGKTWALPNLAADGKTTEDYAIVSRLFDSATGQPLISAAGITQYGTRAAGEFVSDARLLAETLRGVPPDWPRRNLQVLLRTEVFKGTPAPPKVLAAHVW